jgi:hypothetical protein
MGKKKQSPIEHFVKSSQPPPSQPFRRRETHTVIFRDLDTNMVESRVLPRTGYQPTPPTLPIEGSPRQVPTMASVDSHNEAVSVVDDHVDTLGSDDIASTFSTPPRTDQVHRNKVIQFLIADLFVEAPYSRRLRRYAQGSHRENSIH